MADLTPIDTNYKGYRFRSRLEARWAVFFDAMGIKWEYEREGYDLDGVWYLPDFWLPELEIWTEVKGKEPDDEEHEKARRLAAASEHPVIFLPDIPENKFGYDDDAFLSQVARFQGYVPNLDLSLDRIPEDQRRFYAWDWRKPFYWTICGFCGDVALACFRTKWTSCGCLSKAAHMWPKRHRNGNVQLLWVFMYQDTISSGSARTELMAAYDAARQARFEHGERP